MNPALLAGLVIIPLLLIVAIFMALGSDGNEDQARNDQPAVDNTPAVIAPPPVIPESQPDAPRYIPPPTKAQMDVLERNWAPLRIKFKQMLRLRDEGVAFWQKQDHDRAQDKLHAAKDVFNDIRDVAQALLTDGFSDEQYERYLDDYDTELARWSREFAMFAKYLTLRDD